MLVLVADGSAVARRRLGNARRAEGHRVLEAGGAGQALLDAFTAVNDRHGHDTGDAVLVAAAEALQRALRAEDVLGRLGGEEFLAVLPDTAEEAAARAAERLRAAV